MNNSLRCKISGASHTTCRGEMAKARGVEGSKGKGKRRKGLVKGAKPKDVGLDERSKPKFKRNPHKAKTKRKENSAKEKKSPKVETGGEEDVVRVGAKRKGPAGQQAGAKRLKVSQKKVERQPLDRKERRQLKKKKRKNYDIISRTLLLWEKLRRHDLKEAERSSLLEQMMTIITGHIREFSLKHDTARIIQCCLKYGTPQHHTAIFTELKDHIIELSKSKYAKFAVKAMMRVCTPEQRHQLISALYGNVHRLARHKEAAEVVETAYNDYANASERAALVQEFYGRKFALFKGKEEEEKSLEDILASNAQDREHILGNMKEALLKLLDKSVVKHSIVHKALLDFLTHCDETSRSDLIDQLKDVVVEILHTRDGSRVALHCLWHGTAKNRKVIVKSFKSYVKKICMEENGHVVMMGVFDTVDDTVLVKKTLLSEMSSCLDELCDDPYGRRVLLYLLSPRNRQHFSSQFLESVLQPGDGNKHTKKSSDIRHKELLEGVAISLLQLAGEKAGEWALSKPHSPLLLQIAASISGSHSQLFDPLLDMLSVTFDPNDHLVVHPCGHWVVKRLLNSESEEGEGGASFAEKILDRVSADDIQAWTTTNRGAFVTCSLLCSRASGVRQRMEDLLEPVIKEIRTASLQGQKALWNELSSKH